MFYSVVAYCFGNVTKRSDKLVQIENVESQAKKRGPKPKMLVDAPEKVQDKLVVPAPVRNDDLPALAAPAPEAINDIADLEAQLNVICSSGDYKIDMGNRTVTFYGGPLKETCETLCQPPRVILNCARRHFSFKEPKKKTVNVEDVAGMVNQAVEDAVKNALAKHGIEI